MQHCTPEALEVIKVVRDEVLTGPERWTQGSYTADESGLPTSGSAYDAAPRYCLVGAVRRAAKLIVTRNGSDDGSDDGHFSRAYRAEKCLNGVLGAGGGAITFNDNYKTTFEDVRALLNKALEKGTDGGTTTGSEASA